MRSVGAGAAELRHRQEAALDAGVPAARTFNGVATIQQPQVLPLYGGHSAHEALGVLQGNTAPNPQELVRETWEQWAEKEGAQKEGRGDFAVFWHETLRTGIVANSAAPTLPVPHVNDISAALDKPPEQATVGVGYDAYRLRGTKEPWATQATTFIKTGE